MTRQALVTGGSEQTIAAYLPSNYEVKGTTLDGQVIVRGEDRAGWTLDGYVIPRLASGMYFAKECQHDVDSPCTLSL